MLQTIHYPNEIRAITNTPNLPSNENYPIQKQELTAKNQFNPPSYKSF